MHRGPAVSPISSMPYQMMVVLGDLGVDMGWLLGASCVAYCVRMVVFATAYPLIF